MKELFDPEQAVAEARREFGEHGGVSPSIERSSTFTVMEPGAMPEMFSGTRGPDRGGCYLYSRHFNPTVDVLDRYLAVSGKRGAGRREASRDQDRQPHSRARSRLRLPVFGQQLGDLGDVHGG